MSGVLSIARDREKDSKPFGVILACGNCRTKLGEVHFAAPHGVLRIFACPDCGARNDFENSASGITRTATTEATKPGRPAERRSPALNGT